uniref:GAIN-B domain-containing protein n=1 Tax=Amphimedon queenslandica TaxID=400682 RepID=A0A1X7UAB2_AMPQE
KEMCVVGAAWHIANPPLQVGFGKVCKDYLRGKAWSRAEVYKNRTTAIFKDIIEASPLTPYSPVQYDSTEDLVDSFHSDIELYFSYCLIPVTESKEPVATVSFNLSKLNTCITDGLINKWIESSSGYSLCSRIYLESLSLSSSHSFSICQPDDVIFHFTSAKSLLPICGQVVDIISVKVSNSTYAVPVKQCSELSLSLSSPIIRISNESVSVLNSTCGCNSFMINPPRLSNDQDQCFDDQESCPEGYTITAPPLLQCLPGKSLITGTCNKGLFTETSSCSQCGQFNEPVCNYDTQFSSIISMINQSANGALQSLSEQLTQFTLEQSIVLLDNIISKGINTSVVNATEMVLRTAELIVNKLPINETVTVKLSVATQFLLSLDAFALKVVQSTSFDYGNTFFNVSQIESFSGERLTVLNYNGNSLSLPAMIFNNSLPATVASFIYSNLLSILSPTEPDSRKLISPVISATVDCNGTCITDELTEPVVISFSLSGHAQPILSSAISCVFWNILQDDRLHFIVQMIHHCLVASGTLKDVNQSTIGALQSLSEQLTQFTPQQSIALLDNIISEVINITVDVTEAVTVKHSVATQFLLSLDTFALKVAQSTSFGYGNTFSNVTQIESFSGERLTVLNYNGNSLSLPAMIFNNSLPATVASFVYSGNKLLSILSPTEPDNRKLISPVVSATVECNSTCITSELTEPVVITFALLRHAQLISFSTISCVFWNTTLGFWDNEGCNASSVDQQSVTCHCNHLTHFAILPVNRSPIGALQSLFEELDRLTPEQSITLLDNIINRVINITVDVTEMVLRTAELIINELPTNELVTVKLSVVTQFLVSLDTFALNVAESTILPQSTNLTQSTPLNFGNIFLNVTRIESFSGERLTVLNYNGNSLSLPAMIFIDSLPATVASFVYSGNSLLSILSPTEPDNRELISPVISATVECNGTCITDELTEPVIISFNLSGYTEQANFGFFIMSLVIIRRQQKKQGRGIKPQHWIKSALSLTIIMGIGWIGSVLFFSQRLLFIAYIMTIFIAGQGIIIFILYVPLSSNVREAYAKLLKKRLANWSLTRSKASGDSKKKSTEGNLR